MTSDERDIRLSRLREALSSRDRRVVLQVFRKRPSSWLAQAEVSSIVKLPLGQVSGVIRGSRGRYNPELSLLSLGLIEQRETGSGKTKRRAYRFSAQNQSTLDMIDHILKRYQVEEEP